MFISPATFHEPPFVQVPRHLDFSATFGLLCSRMLMDTSSSGSRKRKADMDLRSSCKAAGYAEAALYDELPPLNSSPKRLATDSHCSDISCQSQLLCGEWLDQMTLDSIMDRSPSSMSPSGSLSSFLSVTTAGTAKAQPAEEGAFLGAQMIPFNAASSTAAHLHSLSDTDTARSFRY